ncbi:exonuclease SbcCD subunit D [Candidatus Epulonipiscium viviparus]|uniref:exonuclease SbcCD subunit D n=1 Tax=Candidatus Epulonipiscium viviparus TaxID=420336 RepID=UPI0027380CB3|nr:exonuclease SbcCD subunit D [Candidatus Epulopiscium viviparus]
MKIFHTSDWHIGKVIGNISMIEDQRHILMQFIELSKQEKPDVIIISGDIYDSPTPSISAITLLNEILTVLVMQMKIFIFIVPGDHDNTIQLKLELLKQSNLYLATNKLFERILFIKGTELYHFYLVPFIDPLLIQHTNTHSKISTPEQAMQYIISEIKKTIDSTSNNILITHNFVINYSKAKQFAAIPNIDAINYELFADFDYVALGHLHKRAFVGRKEVCYSGSIAKYSFAEENQIKGINKITISNKYVRNEYLPLLAPKDFQTFTDTLDNILQIGQDFYLKHGHYIQNYIHATLIDEEELLHPLDQLRTVFPNIISIDKPLLKPAKTEPLTNNLEIQTPSDLFLAFYIQCSKTELTEEKQICIKDIINNVIQGGVIYETN